MENKELFVSSEAKKGPREYLADEIMADTGVFDDDSYNLVIKFVNGHKLNPDRMEKAKTIVGEWWFNKYGFPFGLEEERDEVLRRKYGSSKEMHESILLQEELLNAIKEQNKDKIQKLKIRYEKEFPEQLEGVEVLFTMPELLKKSRSFNNHEKGAKFTPGSFRDLCESQFLVTHFILLNSGDKPFLNQFWQVMESIAERDGTKHELNIIRRGIVSQVSVDLILKELGMAPQLSHPREDAFEKTDMWIENKTRVQVKGSEYVSEPAIVSTDEAFFPGVITKEPGKETYFNSKFSYETAQFRAKIKKINPDAEGVFFVIPTHMIDFVTGQPDEKLVEFFRKKMEERKK